MSKTWTALLFFIEDVRAVSLSLFQAQDSRPEPVRAIQVFDIDADQGKGSYRPFTKTVVGARGTHRLVSPLSYRPQLISCVVPFQVSSGLFQIRTAERRQEAGAGGYGEDRVSEQNILHGRISGA